MKPALYDDVLTIITTLGNKPGVRVRIDYAVQKNGETVATGFTEHAFTDDSLCPVRPPKDIREKLLLAWKHSCEMERKLR